MCAGCIGNGGFTWGVLLCRVMGADSPDLRNLASASTTEYNTLSVSLVRRPMFHMMPSGPRVGAACCLHTTATTADALFRL